MLGNESFVLILMLRMKVPGNEGSRVLKFQLSAEWQREFIAIAIELSAVTVG